MMSNQVIFLQGHCLAEKIHVIRQQQLIDRSCNGNRENNNNQLPTPPTIKLTNEKRNTFFTSKKTMLRLSNVLLLSAILGSASAWEEDDRCFKRRLGRDSIANKESAARTPKQSLSVVHEAETAQTARVPLTTRQLAQSETTVFHLKMYWEEGFCWQNEWRERAWCFDCDGRDCNIDDIVSTQICADTPLQEFVWIPDENKNDGRGWLKVANKDLCLERVTGQSFRLQPCDSNGNRQKFVGFSFTKPFELKPVGYDKNCISQLHHPKPDEELYGESCSSARRSFTNKWQVWWPKKVDLNEIVENNFPVLTLPDRSCTSDEPCGVCAGDCDNDDHCEGELECYQRRSSENPDDRIPGCSGDGEYSYDYCYDPKAPAVQEGRQKLITHYYDCTEDEKCQECYGDCDNDDECLGKLKCHQRTDDENPWESVPGCYSLGKVAFDYCYDPDSSSDQILAAPDSASRPTPAPVSVPNTTKELVTLSKDCTPESPCGQCFGDCGSDDECKGNLECFRRSENMGNSLSPVPGCSGAGVKNQDYCYDPEDKIKDVGRPTNLPEPSPNNSEELVSRSGDCTPGRPCPRCYGDCGRDDDCEGNLKCFRRSIERGNSDSPIPGCSGTGVRDRDYCYDPKDAGRYLRF